MKTILLILTIILFTECQGVIGSKNNETIVHVEWVLGTDDNPPGYSYTNKTLQVMGMITNTGDTTIIAPWFVEAEFWADSTFEIILGGDQFTFNFNLYSGKSTEWDLEYSSANKVESNYPNFAIYNFRAFISKN